MAYFCSSPTFLRSTQKMAFGSPCTSQVKGSMSRIKGSLSRVLFVHLNRHQIFDMSKKDKWGQQRKWRIHIIQLKKPLIPIYFNIKTKQWVQQTRVYFVSSLYTDTLPTGEDRYLLFGTASSAAAPVTIQLDWVVPDQQSQLPRVFSPHPACLARVCTQRPECTALIAALPARRAAIETRVSVHWIIPYFSIAV